MRSSYDDKQKACCAKPPLPSAWRCHPLVIGSLTLVATAAIYPNAGLIYLTALSTFLAWLGWIAIGSLLRATKRPPARTQWSLRYVMLLVTCLAVIVGTVADAWPFQLRIALSRASLDRLAALAESGKPPTLPQCAGLFVIRKIERRSQDGVRCTILWTDPDSSYPSGFIRPASEGAKLFLDWSAVKSTGDWHFFIDD